MNASDWWMKVVRVALAQESELGDLYPEQQQITTNDCSHCGGLRYVRRDLEIDDSDFGKAFPCPSCSR